MLSAIKDLIAAISITVAFAFSIGNQDWIWRQIASVRYEALVSSKADWGCPSIFRKDACRYSP
jgi:hypothetical protein